MEIKITTGVHYIQYISLYEKHNVSDFDSFYQNQIVIDEIKASDLKKTRPKQNMYQAGVA